MTDRRERTEFFADLGWGIFTHYIGYGPQDSGCTRSGFRTYRDWNDRVNAFNTDAYARTLHSVGAHYAFFTLMQGSPFLCAPNDTYNAITGAKPGESCSERDLVGDLIESLGKYDIPLFLYYTGDGPYKDEKHGNLFGYHDREVEVVNTGFVEKWTAVMAEYAKRYGSSVKGWWIDGAYPMFGYTEELLRPYREAALSGNPDAIISFNNGVARPDTSRPEIQKYLNGITHPLGRIQALEPYADKDPAVLAALSNRPGNSERYTELDDFTAGETDSFDELPPENGMVEGSRWHILGFLGQYVNWSPVWYGGGWDCLGSRYSGAYMRDYVRKCTDHRGVVTVDTYLFDDGRLDEGQLEVLKAIEK